MVRQSVCDGVFVLIQANEWGNVVEVATVDSFQVQLVPVCRSTVVPEVTTIFWPQGREKDVVVFVTVRHGKSLGFLSHFERVNVALSRARLSLLVIGHKPTLERSGLWR